MTIMSVCSVYDTTANLFGSPFVSISAETAKREFQAELTNPNARGPMQTHPADFKLFELGVFSNEQGQFQLHDQPQFLYQGSAI